MNHTTRARRALIYGCCALLLAAGAGDAAYAAAGSATGMTVAPLADDFGGQAPASGTPAAGQGTAQAPAGNGRAAPSGGALATDQAGGQRQVRDDTVLAYLIELARKQNRPCPSGVTPPSPPSLIFSEPLCRVAEAAAKGEDVRAAMAGQGLYAARWRTFGAGDAPAQAVATSLREKHCEALLEPHTHIGVFHGPAGWSVVLAVLTAGPSAGKDTMPAPSGGIAAKPETGPGAAGALSGGGPAAAASASASAPVPAPAFASASMPAPVSATAAAAVSAPAPLPGEAEVPDLMARPSAPPAVPDSTGQEARKLFMRINAQREKGGSCLGRTASPAPPLAFDPDLQAAAEQAVAEMTAKGSTGGARGASNVIAGTGAYAGGQITKLTARTSASATASAIVDIWMLNPNDCGVLFSPLFTDAGVAHAGGNWVVLLGAKGKGVPSPEPGQPGFVPSPR